MDKVSDHAGRGSCAAIATLAGTLSELSEDDMDGGSAATKLHILDSHCCGTYRSSAKEFKVKIYGMWLVIRGESGFKVQLYGCEHIARDDTPMGHVPNRPRVMKMGSVCSGVDCFDGCRFREGSHWTW